LSPVIINPLHFFFLVLDGVGLDGLDGVVLVLDGGVLVLDGGVLVLDGGVSVLDGGVSVLDGIKLCLTVFSLRCTGLSCIVIGVVSIPVVFFPGVLFPFPCSLVLGLVFFPFPDFSSRVSVSELDPESELSELWLCLCRADVCLGLGLGRGV